MTSCRFEDMNKWIFILLFLPVSLLAQKVSTAHLSFTNLSEDDELIIIPSVSFDFNNHNWSVGPTLLYSFGDQVEERDPLKITGIKIGYENFLHGKEDKWNLFHSFDFIAQRVKDSQNSQYFDLSSNSFIPNSIEQVESRFYLGANLGVLLNLSERLSVDKSIGIGFNGVFRNTESTIEQFSDSFLSQRWLLKIGLRYSL